LFDTKKLGYIPAARFKPPPQDVAKIAASKDEEFRK
jgi:hypothetical protein